jgi:hypothetical protein
MKKLLYLFAIHLCVFASSPSAQAGAASPNTVPDKIEVPANQELALTLTAQGVQIYKCQAVPGEPDKFEWMFQAPDADLYDTKGHKVGRHFAGPTWELNAGDKVVGRVKAKADSPNGKGVPWLLIDAVQASGSTLGKVQSIQRINTIGGKAPANANADKDGKVEKVKYSATYKFYVVAK